MKRHPWLLVVLGAAALGFVFSAFATFDFAQHLDREVHAIHCSFVPGLAATDASGGSGCQVTMMSPYSSVFRTSLWGGLPIALPGMGVFAFLLFLVGEMILANRGGDRGATGLLLLATAVPALTSVVMGYISFVTLDAACKLCIGIYVASALALLGAFMARGQTASGPPLPPPDPRDADLDATRPDTGRLARAEDEPSLGESEGLPPLEPPRPARGPVDQSYVLGAVVVAALCVGVPSAAYAMFAPSHDALITACGGLERPRDLYKIMLPLGGPKDGAPVIEVLDPLCPACKAFETRLEASGLVDHFSRKVVLFPLDNTCNWMVEGAIHPGACTVSEAVLCAEDKADDVLAWAFANQEAILSAAKANPNAARKMVVEKFPSVQQCLGSSAVRAKLNKSLRWAVRNNLQVLTPQFYVGGVKLCDEDVDLGLDYALARLLDMHAAGTLPTPKEKPEPARLTEPAPTTQGDSAAAPEAAPGGEAVAAPAPSEAAAPSAAAPEGVQP